MASDPVTNYVETTEDVVQQVKAWLAAAQKAWSVVAFSGTSADDIGSFLSGLRGPAAVVMYMGSRWNNDPLRRVLDIDVVLVSDNHISETAGYNVRTMLTEAVKALDGQLLNQAYFQAASDTVMDLGPGKGAIKLKFTVEDN